MLVNSITLGSPLGRMHRTSPCSKNWPGSVSRASRSATAGMSSGSMKSVIGVPRYCSKACAYSSSVVAPIIRPMARLPYT